MLEWSEGTDNGRQKTRNHGCVVIVGGEPFTDYLITLANLSAKPKTKSIGAGRYQLFPVGGMPTASSLPERLLSEKSVTPALQQIKERGDLPMIDRGDIRQASTVAAISGLHCRALVMVSSSIRLTA